MTLTAAVRLLEETMRYGIAREHITRLWWVIQDTGRRWPEATIRQVSGPYQTEAEAAQNLPALAEAGDR